VAEGGSIMNREALIAIDALFTRLAPSRGQKAVMREVLPAQLAALEREPAWVAALGELQGLHSTDAAEILARDHWFKSRADADEHGARIVDGRSASSPGFADADGGQGGAGVCVFQ
jgi:hypothetical protein